MHDNRSHPPFSLSFAPPSHFLCHGFNATLPLWKDLAHPDHVMFLFHGSSVLSFILFSVHLSSFLLTKLIKFVFLDKIFERDVVLEIPHVTADECYQENEDLIADILEGDTLAFLHRESAFNDNLVTEQGKDSEEVVALEGSDTFAPESTYDSPLEDLSHDKIGVEYDDVSTTTTVLTILDSQVLLTLEVNTCDEDKASPNTEEQQEFSGDDEENVITDTDIKSPNSCGEGLHVEEKDTFAGSLNGESTSKSSVEWRSSTIFRDSETDYSSSRRSSSRWESYALFRKYDEEMLFFDRITAQKLSETESLRSIKVHPRSISERIVHRLSTKPRSYCTTGSRKDPYQELESAYVAQICLTWEALNWNYTNFRQKSSELNNGCPARIAQQFQQFQVLLQRFIENEPYEYGRRPEVYARRRISSPKLLQVPEFRDSEGGEGKEDTSSNISSDEFVVILEYAIQTFMNFLKADREKCGDKVRAFIKRKSSSADPIFHRFLKKANKKKKLRLRDMGKRQRCMAKKRRLKQEEEMEILMGLIDLKVASRVLRMAEISSQQLHWCEEKMRKVRVWDGKMQRDSTPLFFPVH